MRRYYVYLPDLMNVSFSRGQRYFFFGLLAVVTIFFLWMVRGFLFPIFWAVVFALLLYPAYQTLRTYVRNDTLAATLIMLGAFLLVVIPISWLGTRIAQEAFQLYRLFSGNNALASIALPAPIIDSLSIVGINMAELQTNVTSWAQSASAWIFSEALTLSSATFNAVLKTLLMLYVLFFFLRDGETLGRYIMRRIPLGDRKERALFDRFASTTRAIMKGTVFSAVAQGFVGGLLFSLAGIENAVLWGAAMAFFSIIPAIGPSLVWLPAGLILLATGALVPGIIVLAGGAVLISPIDNILKPMLVGREIKMPDALVLISILGGLGVFGVAGIIVGPVVAALSLAVWDMFAEEFEEELTTQG